jgi:hypothetical protein
MDNNSEVETTKAINEIDDDKVKEYAQLTQAYKLVYANCNNLPECKEGESNLNDKGTEVCRNSLTDVEIRNALNLIDNNKIKEYAQLVNAYELIYGNCNSTKSGNTNKGPISAESDNTLPMCREGENNLNDDGKEVCRIPSSDAFTNVNRKSKKERKIENFSQNQKCKARY